uniref:DNA 5'-3' helicase DnaB n=1 Tax=Bangia fuscopurpurea TaxID=101920 RepID=A0A0F6VXK8_BANFU|nr:replication helicase subunit [Bangia fuscopurpurea]
MHGDLLYSMSCSKKQITQYKINSLIELLTVANDVLDNKETQTLARDCADLLIDLDATKIIVQNTGILSGFDSLDVMTQGFQKSDLIIIAGRPSMGKTAFAITITRHIVKTSKSSVIFFSLEMSTEQLIRRFLAQECQLNSQRIQSGQISSKEWQYVLHESKAIANLNFYIDDSANNSVGLIKTKLKFLKLQGKEIDFIIIDYLQLLQDNQQSDNRSQELSLITRSLKILAREFNLPILVLSQLNRNLESRSDKRPLLSDLRESGCISKLSFIYIGFKKLANQTLFNFQYKKIKLNNFNQKTTKLFTPETAWISKTGKKPIYRITTESSKYLDLTSNHKLLTLIGWKRCDELKINDMAAIQVKHIQSRRHLLKSCSSLTFEHIVHINITNIQTVFDLTCDELSNFIANNIIVHNSIEQDADIVIMLYRDKYYNKEAESKEITEVIVAKHRNGPIGTFTLKFNTNLASFFNI